MVGNPIYNNRCSHPTWSPDSQKIAFLDVPGGIRVMPMAGGPALSLAGTTGALEVAWQP